MANKKANKKKKVTAKKVAKGKTKAPKKAIKKKTPVKKAYGKKAYKKKPVQKKTRRIRKTEKTEKTVDSSAVSISKVLGHCPECNLTICTNDLLKGKKFIFECPSCGCNGRTKTLLKEPENKRPRPTNKKEYMEPTFSGSNDNWFSNYPDRLFKDEESEIEEFIDEFLDDEDTV